ncbi:hypothetical protein Pcinc_004588 [Petrolisthes cinctipes]|uniref:Uncharacterized protein n=1 Tax=Petrolisthes cinctipes TaxID=88211 RepID=A0AAE1GL24_PETCI|nr:hypothetical protein Pcinc_004588 [Petrolisthes cinctipes]
MSIGPFGMSAVRAEAVDFSDPILIDYARILAGKGSPEVDPWGFMLPLTPVVWVAFFSSLLFLLSSVYLLVFFVWLKDSCQIIQLDDISFAYVRVLLQQAADKASEYPSYDLLAANGTSIATYGTRTLNLDLGLPEKIIWSFIVADVRHPILGLDFIYAQDLLVDSRYQQLHHRPTTCTIKATPCEEIAPQITHLRTTEYVLVRHDANRAPLQRPYDGPFRVLDRTPKYITIDKNGRAGTVSIDRIKPAYTPVHPATSEQSPPQAPPVQPPPTPSRPILIS